MRLGFGLILACLAGIQVIPNGVATAQPAQARHPLIGSTIGVDHVSLWGQDRLDGERRLEQLGFNLTAKPGSYGAGISNKLIWFENRSYIEYLWISDRDKAAREAPDEYGFAARQSGVTAFAIQVENARQTFDALKSAGVKGEFQGAENWDPDGPDGPAPPEPAMWRNIFLQRGQVPGSPYFIQYNLPPIHRYPAHYHPNGARQISSIWMIVADVDAAAAAYGKAGFRRGRVINLPDLGLAGISLAAGAGEIFLLKPGASSPFSKALQQRGDHVGGISVKVASLEQARGFVHSAAKPPRALKAGPFGPWVMAPWADQLGLAIAFHE